MCQNRTTLASDTVIQVKAPSSSSLLANSALLRPFPTFPGGTISDPFPTNSFLPFVEIPRKHRQLGGDASFLGPAISGIEDDSYGGYWVKYMNGSIVYTSATGAHMIHGEVYKKWVSLAGLVNIFGAAMIGFPVNDTTSVVYGGLYNLFAAKRGPKKAIYWSPNTPTCTIEGPILDTFKRLAGASGVGFPIRDTKTLPLGGMIGNFKTWGGLLQDIYWSELSGAHALWGPIREKYLALGAEKIGWPVTEVIGENNGPGAYAEFSNGMTIIHSPEGTFTTVGAIRYRYQQLGGYLGYGYPLNDQTHTADGVGYSQHFTGGRAIYHPGRRGRACAIYGEILKRYEALGGPSSFLGYPTKDEGQGSTNGGRFTDFTGGTIYWSPQTGAVESASIADQLEFSCNHHFSNGVVANGSSKLIMKRDGTYDFVGHMHASGAMSYNFICTYTMVDADGLVYVFASRGTIFGTFVPGSRHKDWHDNGVNENIRDNWRAINAQYRMHINAHMGTSPGVLIAEIFGVTALAAIGVIVAIVIITGGRAGGGGGEPKVTWGPPDKPGTLRIEWD